MSRLVHQSIALMNGSKLRHVFEECHLTMDSSLKFDQESAVDIDNIDKRTSYRLCYKDRIKVISARSNADKTINTTLREPSREVLRLTKVNSVNIIQTKIIHDGNSIKDRSVTSVERRTTPSLYLPHILGNKCADIAPAQFNKATYRSFRTQQERKCLAFSRSLERDKQLELFNGKDKRLGTTAVIDISKPAPLHSRYQIMQLRSAR